MKKTTIALTIVSALSASSAFAYCGGNSEYSKACFDGYRAGRESGLATVHRVEDKLDSEISTVAGRIRVTNGHLAENIVLSQQNKLRLDNLSVGSNDALKQSISNVAERTQQNSALIVSNGRQSKENDFRLKEIEKSTSDYRADIDANSDKLSRVNGKTFTNSAEISINRDSIDELANQTDKALKQTQQLSNNRADANSMAIGQNNKAIGDLAESTSSAIAKNTGDIQYAISGAESNAQRITENSNELQYVKSGVESNSGRISDNGTRIDSLTVQTDKALKQTQKLANNRADINAKAIGQNNKAIGDLAESTHSALSKQDAEIAMVDGKATANRHDINKVQAEQVNHKAMIDGNAQAIGANNKAIGDLANNTAKEFDKTNNAVKVNSASIEKVAVDAGQTRQDASTVAIANSHAIQSNHDKIMVNREVGKQNAADIQVTREETNQAFAKVDHAMRQNQRRIGDNESAIASNRAAIDRNSAEIKDLRSDLERQGREVAGIGAMSAAYAGLGQAYNVGGTAVTWGLGAYNDAHAIAVGASHRFNEHLSVKVGGAYQDGTNKSSLYAGGTYEW